MCDSQKSRQNVEVSFKENDVCFLGASYYISEKVAHRQHTSLPISIESGTHNKQATFLGSTHVCFLGATFCDIINGAQCKLVRIFDITKLKQGLDNQAFYMCRSSQEPLYLFGINLQYVLLRGYKRILTIQEVIGTSVIDRQMLTPRLRLQQKSIRVGEKLMILATMDPYKVFKRNKSA